VSRVAVLALCALFLVPLAIATPTRNIEIRDFAFSPDPTHAVLSIRVDNPGAAATTPTRADAIVLDAQGAANVVGSTTIPAIAAGGFVVLHIDWPQAPLVGNSRVAILVDPDNLVIESDEVNDLVGGDVHVGLLAAL
jgi:hypothetical protein